ncbi:soluble pyridine nucleotide transhydrogenase [Pseudoalteromonas sp. SW0106-04]|uniref:Si-specific NAD(P)(+) transhydrogenase n=1 Tax=Pseudoalteromonas TaxID=53246 RepID=UPI0006B65F79|nr:MULTISPECIES: Si-specific NAD(P)(+) transhydrogenase [Pseudoalteromonas]GAP77027.1 soluble pyridine nucleotide transhydrogenase [Pseudoalteromonas sp. SW0106-04]
MAKQTASKKQQPKAEASYQYDAIIIGTGPGGEGTAMNLAKSHKKVAVIERQQAVGGGCVHWGTIPSKALRHSVSRYIEYKANPLFNITERPGRITFADILNHTSSVISKQSSLRSSFYERNRIDLFQGEASFVDKTTVNVQHQDGSFERLSAPIIVIATGSRPYRPKEIDFNHPRVFDSDTILSLKDDPQRILIYGAGVIGCEYASIFKGLGMKVDLVNTRDRLLAFMDDEISDALSYHFWNSGIFIRHNEEFDHVETKDDGIIMHMKSGKRVKADCLLFANGRTGNTDTLNLQAIGLKADGRGQLKVNESYQTEVDNVYAVGDVIGYPSLASAAFDQGRICADAIVQGECKEKLIIDIPAGIYTIPEMSSVGKTEQQLTAAKIPYEVGRAQFKHLARAQIAGTDVGSLKILFHSETKEVLGVHCFGERASEIVHIGQAIMEQKGSGNNVEYFVNTTFNYPTMAEAYRVAALNGLNRLV